MESIIDNDIAPEVLLPYLRHRSASERPSPKLHLFDNDLASSKKSGVHIVL